MNFAPRARRYPIDAVQNPALYFHALPIEAHARELRFLSTWAVADRLRTRLIARKDRCMHRSLLSTAAGRSRIFSIGCLILLACLSIILADGSFSAASHAAPVAPPSPSGLLNLGSRDVHRLACDTRRSGDCLHYCNLAYAPEGPPRMSSVCTHHERSAACDAEWAQCRANCMRQFGC
jgi:hypothetical protein